MWQDPNSYDFTPTLHTGVGRAVAASFAAAGPSLFQKPRKTSSKPEFGRLDILINNAGSFSIRAHRGDTNYQSSKLAVQRFTEFVDVEYGKEGVLKMELSLVMPEAMHSVLTDTPELCADAIVFYTAERRDWLAGRYVSVQWDMQELLQKRKKLVRDDLLKVRLDVGLE